MRSRRKPRQLGTYTFWAAGPPRRAQRLRASVTDWGRAPTIAEPVPAEVDLPGDGWRASWLDAKGQRQGRVALTETSDGVRFKAHGQQRSLWYLLER